MGAGDASSAVDAHVDGDNLVAFATELGTGKPAAGVDARDPAVRHQRRRPTTRASRRSPLGARRDEGRALPRRDGAATTSRSSPTTTATGTSTAAGSSRRARKQLAWYVIDDRKMYKPGEEVSLKGWLRTIDYGKNGDVGGSAARSTTRHVQGRPTRGGNQIAQGSAPVNAVGGFDTKFTLPKTPNLGYANVAVRDAGPASRLRTRTASRSRSSAGPSSRSRAQASQGPFLVGGGGDVTVDAKYYAGGPLPGAPVNWYVTASQTTFTPPNRDDYMFGEWEPWWGYRGWSTTTRAAAAATSAPKTLDARGQDRRDRRARAAPRLPVGEAGDADVGDRERERSPTSIARRGRASAALIVHPSSLLRRAQDEAAVRREGHAVRPRRDRRRPRRQGRARREDRGQGRAPRLGVQEGQVHAEGGRSADVRGGRGEGRRCRARSQTTKGGTYQVTATIVDAKGRAEPDEADVLGRRAATQPPAREVAQERVAADPRQEGVHAGQHRRAAGAGAVLSGRGRRDVAAQRHRQDRAHHADRPDDDRSRCRSPTRWCRTCTCRSISSAWRRAPTTTAIRIRSCRSGPAYAVGTINLPVPPKQRTLAVDGRAERARSSRPARATKLAVEVQGCDGQAGRRTPRPR